MKRLLYGIFAHPDDEAFGPAGTLIKEAREGSEVHLISLTLGDAGCNPNGCKNLASVREKEWRLSGDLIGATSLHYLGYRDGTMCNQSMVEIGEKLIALIADKATSLANGDTIELMSIDLNGVTGHIDHIVAARASAYAYYKLKAAYPQLVSRLRLVCLPNHYAPSVNVDWIYMEAGRNNNEIDEIVDAREYNEQIISVMRAHATQKSDGERHIKMRGNNVGLNYFRVIK
ncbi:hypothetical protein FJZ39_01330 [Candidatus Saccharibacteria bacterium]|nr:hypothetical protein [Candidatus Saccharibacteria bacterium]